jgi:dTDP-glucose 4,6-dehydratase
LPSIVSNCSNNYGPRQHAEKLIPTVIRNALSGDPIPIYGSGENVRDWLYVDDHVAGLMAVLERGRPGDTFLFGGHCNVRNIDLARKICLILDTRAPRKDGNSYSQQIEFVTDRPGHDFRYSVDPSYAERTLGWTAKERIESGLTKTIDWYLENRDWLLPGKVLGRLGGRRAGIIGAAS